MTIEQIEAEIATLPGGYISKKIIRNRECYYLQWREGSQVKSRYIKKDELEKLQHQIERRKELQSMLVKEQEKQMVKRISTYAKRIAFLQCKVPIGVQNYATLVEGKGFYIDKTSFIKEWWEHMDEITLITRPRRFGKTLTMSMLQCFFSNQYADRGDLFAPFSIWTSKKYRDLQGAYPVLLMSFGSIKVHSYEGQKAQIKEELYRIYQEYWFLEEQNLLTEEERKQFHRIAPDMDDATAVSCVPALCRILSRIYHKKVIILLDEYDTPMLEAWGMEEWEACAEFIRNIFNAMFKINPYLERGLMTGITRVSKESFFSDLNHIYVAGYETEDYSTSFGFTEQEVFDAMDKRGMTEKDKVKEWYDGFCFGSNRDIYNPWSIINYFRIGEFRPYWANSGSNKMVSALFQRGNVSLKYALEDLLNGKSILRKIDYEISLRDLTYDEDSVWKLLVAAGYLKIINRDESGLSEIVITNKEVHGMIKNLIFDWFAKSDNYSGFKKAMMQNDVDFMNYYMERVIYNVFSYFDVNDGKEPERFYHGFVLGLLVDLEHEYIITSNRESGIGRYDISMQPRDPQNRPAIIMEFKIRQKQKEKTLVETAERALAQIEEKQYDRVLVQQGIDKNNIRKYGFAFDGKEVCIVGGG